MARRSLARSAISTSTACICCARSTLIFPSRPSRNIRFTTMTARCSMGMDDIASFATWQTTRSVDCPYPPCINDVQRPDPRLGIINSFESQSSSVYSGLTVSLKRQMPNGVFFRIGYTFAKAIDDGQDALVVGTSRQRAEFLRYDSGARTQRRRPAEPLRGRVGGGTQALPLR